MKKRILDKLQLILAGIMCASVALLLKFIVIPHIPWLFWVCLAVLFIIIAIFRKTPQQIVNPKLVQRFPDLSEVFLTPQYTKVWYLARGEDVGYFCDKGGNPNEKTLHNISLLHLAVGGGDMKNVRELLHYGADIHAKDDKGLTPLDYAQKYQETAIATLLQNILVIEPLVKTWNWHVQSDLVWDGVFFALLTANDNDVFYFLDKGYVLKRLAAQNITYLHVAAALGRLTACKTLCDFKADVLAKDKQDRTPIDWAQLCKQTETLEYLTHMAKHRHEWAPGRIKYTQKEQKEN
ncbi:MAG: ankyrin repeat domain-containing protein [Elusimicrobiaceae bacterium]|nr:ankyrin repeat domain-containing protein [Elusimicrobiaceae bacterium]